MAFVEMGGYGAYVWPAFGATTVVLVVLAVASVRQLRSREQILAGLQQAVRPRREAHGGKGAS